MQLPPQSVTLTELIIDSAVISGCQHGHSYASTARCLRLVSRTVACILDGWDVTDFRTGIAAAGDLLKQSGMKRAAKSLKRLCCLGKMEKVNQEPMRSVLVRDRTNIGKRVVTKIRDKVLRDMREVLKLAKFIGGSCDESVVVGKTRPMFLNLQAITNAFQWFMFVAGQSNSAGNGTGAENALSLITMLTVLNLTLEDVLTWGTDGCYAMRSNVAGVDARAVGDSMMAALKSLADPMRLLAFHCCLHIVNLSIRFGIKIAVPSFWEKHIRALYTWGARSVKRQHEFCQRHKDALSRTKDFLQVVGNVAEIHSWQWTYFDRYVIVRWETIVKCLRSALINWVGTRSVANVQRDSGWGPWKYAAENEDQADDDDDRWEDILEMSHFDTGNEDAPKTKRSRLLHELTGVTDLNWGLNAGLYTVLAPVQVVLKLLQTTRAPIQHFAVRHINRIYDHLQDVVDGNWKTATVYAPFVTFCQQQNRVDLCNAVNEIVENFAHSVLKDLRRRLQPYMPYYQAMELVDPAATVDVRSISPEVRAAVQDICGVHGLPDAAPALLRMRSRINSGRMSPVSSIEARKNILSWYTNKVGLRELLSTSADRRTVKKYALSVFSIHIVTAVTESTVSGVKNQKSKYREDLSDGAATTSLQCQQYPDVAGTTCSSTGQPLRVPCIDMNACFDYDYSCHYQVDLNTGENSDVNSDVELSNSDLSD